MPVKAPNAFQALLMRLFSSLTNQSRKRSNRSPCTLLCTHCLANKSDNLIGSLSIIVGIAYRLSLDNLHLGGSTCAKVAHSTVFYLHQHSYPASLFPVHSSKAGLAVFDLQHEYQWRELNPHYTVLETVASAVGLHWQVFMFNWSGRIRT